jgi:hypothetical protein
MMFAAEGGVAVIREDAQEERLLHLAGTATGGVERPQLDAARKADELSDGEDGETRHHTGLVADSAGAAHVN